MGESHKLWFLYRKRCVAATDISETSPTKPFILNFLPLKMVIMNDWKREIAKCFGLNDEEDDDGAEGDDADDYESSMQLPRGRRAYQIRKARGDPKEKFLLLCPSSSSAIRVCFALSGLPSRNRDCLFVLGFAVDPLRWFAWGLTMAWLVGPLRAYIQQELIRTRWVLRTVFGCKAQSEASSGLR